MSSIFFAILKDNHNIEGRLVTGNLSFKDNVIFKQDFSIMDFKEDSLQTWAGHAWVTVEGKIFDLSIFRTVYSDEFIKPCKGQFVDAFGLGRGCLIASPEEMKKLGLMYEEIERLNNDVVTSIVQGIEKLPIWD